ncbi:acyl carrier protein [Actinomadura rugatobispora]|uniref:Acyl carrier protein n=1 Tax=Actinomadura rugatobispora TaxID=1994 RepID=A0ABW1A9A6_9ACTN|nr:meromycolate extension acyl carrier protein AcpM [Actinomadura rugatobispora]
MALSEQEILDGIADILHEEIGVPLREVGLGKRLGEDLGLAGSDLLEIFATVRERFAVELPEDEITTFATIGDVVAHLQGTVG